MTRISQLIITLIALVAIVLPASGQGLTASSGPSLSLRFRALETMNSTVSDSLGKSKQREQQMSDYIKAKGLSDQWQAYTAAPKNLPHAMSFNDALNIAIDHERTMGPVEQNQDPNLGREVQAYTNLVKGSWEQYQASMVTVARMSDFLNEHGEFEGYPQWAHVQNQQAREANAAAAKQRAEEKAKEDKERKQEAWEYEKQAQADLKKQHQEYLKTQWQHYAFNMKQQTQRDKYGQQHGNGYWNNYGDGYGDCGW